GREQVPRFLAVGPGAGMARHGRQGKAWRAARLGRGGLGKPIMLGGAVGRQRGRGNAGACGALEGEVHQFGCDDERCTKCGGQFLYCDCPEDYADRKRVPFFRLHWLCCQRCGAPWPEFFSVPDDVWQHYILALGGGNPLLCVDCFNFIAELTDGGEYARQQGGPIMLRDPAWRERLKGGARGATAWCLAG